MLVSFFYILFKSKGHPLGEKAKRDDSFEAPIICCEILIEEDVTVPIEICCMKMLCYRDDTGQGLCKSIEKLKLVG
ncbi:MAG: hypothetical protein C1941_03180 [Prosthecochloris sp.]|nr:hypothetical protein [Prosthecochloris sp.]